MCLKGLKLTVGMAMLTVAAACSTPKTALVLAPGAPSASDGALHNSTSESTSLQPAAPTAQASAEAQAQGRGHGHGQVIGRNERLLVYLPAAGDAWSSIAAKFLGSPAQAWQLAQANPDAARPQPGQPVVVPLVPRNPLGVTAAGAQSVPILCYHRIAGGSSKLTVSPANFEAQMDWLASNGYRVVRLSELAAFLAGKLALPPRSVVVTFDDGYESVYRHAFAVLKRLQIPATLFVYTDFLGAADALDWTQLEVMWASGLVDVQAHSKTHRRLTERLPGETDAVYRSILDTELRLPRTLIERRFASSGLKVRHFAYPFGDADETVLDAMKRQGYEIGVTVVPGSNPFYASPLLLRRVMIYGDHSLDDFKARLHGARSAG